MNNYRLRGRPRQARCKHPGMRQFRLLSRFFAAFGGMKCPKALEMGFFKAIGTIGSYFLRRSKNKNNDSKLDTAGATPCLP